MEPLWGKFHTSGVTLYRHTLAVVDAGDALFGRVDKPSRLGFCWLRFFKLPPETWPHFYWNLLATELLHDWGKANDGMQRVLTGQGEQKIWHEHFSALLIALENVTTWLSGNTSLDVPLVLSAVLTHHLRASGRADGFASAATGAVVKIVDRDGQFAELVRLTGERLGLDTFDLKALPERWVVGKPPNDVRAHRTRIQDLVIEPLRRDMSNDNRRRLLTAVRAALIAADAAGSGYVREGYEVKAEVWRQFVERKPWTGNSIRREIIDKRVAELNEQFKRRDKPPFDWNPFQLACDELPDRARLLAPCGSGKTLAAWRWIAARADRRPASRVLFLYPTRATAKEGFRDYVSWRPRLTRR